MKIPNLHVHSNSIYNHPHCIISSHLLQCINCLFFSQHNFQDFFFYLLQFFSCAYPNTFFFYFLMNMLLIILLKFLFIVLELSFLFQFEKVQSINLFLSQYQVKFIKLQFFLKEIFINHQALIFNLKWLLHIFCNFSN